MPFLGRVAVAEVGLGPSWMRFPYDNPMNKELDVREICIPRSSLTRLSSSAILLRRRVVSSMLGSSLHKMMVSLRVIHYSEPHKPECRIVNFIHAKTSLKMLVSVTSVVRGLSSTYQAELDASLAWALAVALSVYQCQLLSIIAFASAYLAFRRMTVQTGLCSPVAPPLEKISQRSEWRSEGRQVKHTSFGDLFPCQGRSP